VRIIDAKVKKNAGRYILQCGLATVTVFVILLFLDILTQPAIIATLGATTLIVFTMPKSYASGFRPLIGGYIVGVACGCLCYFLSVMPFFVSRFSDYILLQTVFGALAVGSAIFLMAITNTEHAPAAGMALSLVINTWDLSTLAFVLVGVLFLAGIRNAMQRFLLDVRDIRNENE
jgi:CBS-domain-containing membrane protein